MQNQARKQFRSERKHCLGYLYFTFPMISSDSGGQGGGVDFSLASSSLQWSSPGHHCYNLLPFINGFWQHSDYVNHCKKESHCFHVKTSQFKEYLMLVRCTKCPLWTHWVEHFGLCVAWKWGSSSQLPVTLAADTVADHFISHHRKNGIKQQILFLGIPQISPKTTRREPSVQVLRSPLSQVVWLQSEGHVWLDGYTFWYLLSVLLSSDRHPSSHFQTSYYAAYSLERADYI